MTTRLLLFSQLVRPLVSLMVGGATLFGALLHGGPESWAAGLEAALAAVVVCGGCSVLNQVQERDVDARMQRTASRPLVTGQISPAQGLALGVALLLPGLAGFYAAGGLASLAVGVVVVMVYNGLYTPLKRRSILALLVGAVPGSLPPLVGWLAAGGSVAAPAILALVAVFFLWQVPHFWLLAEKYRTDYERAGLPVPMSVLPVRQYKQLMTMWTSSYFLGMGCLAVGLGADMAPLLTLILVLMTGLGTLAGIWAWKGQVQPALAVVNGSMVLSMGLLLVSY